MRTNRIGLGWGRLGKVGLGRAGSLDKAVVGTTRTCEIVIQAKFLLAGMLPVRCIISSTRNVLIV